LLCSKIIETAWLNETTKHKAWDFFRKHSDKIFSFTDCTSFMIMKEMRVNRYFSFDSDFRQAGFVEYGTQ
jgi:predicted nucleic acid-binding protein